MPAFETLLVKTPTKAKTSKSSWRNLQLLLFYEEIYKPSLIKNLFIKVFKGFHRTQILTSARTGFIAV